MDLHNSFMDIHRPILHIMDIHTPIMDIDSLIMDILDNCIVDK